MILRSFVAVLILVAVVTNSSQGEVMLRDNGGDPNFALIDKVTNVFVTGTSYAPGYFDFTFNYGNSYAYWQAQFGTNVPLMWWNTQADALVAMEAIRAEVAAFGDVTGTVQTEDVYMAYSFGTSVGTVNVVFADNLGGTNYSQWWNPPESNPRFQFNRNQVLPVNPLNVWVTTAYSPIPEPAGFTLLLALLPFAGLLRVARGRNCRST